MAEMTGNPDAITLGTGAITLTRELIEKMLTTIDAGVTPGLGSRIPGEMCVEAAISYALGLPHSDDPQCVNSAVRSFVIHLNDVAWSSTAARAAGMRRLAIAQLGTRETLDSKVFISRMIDLINRVYVPIVIRSVAGFHPSPTLTRKLEAAAHRCADTGSHDAVLDAAGVVESAASSRFRLSKKHRNMVNSAASFVTDIAIATDDEIFAPLAPAKATTLALDTASTLVHCSDNPDTLLAAYAEAIVQVLSELRAPGIRWMPLARQ
ncbi:hypothetical protein [uncultured Bosea sp.]|uniref:hypothetical protein n=1 Tax=uncultured Bosea sp. TaxID=211457 RepID=UPI0025DD8368|nr:hypothetical protein [uncultured Bosea sp.]